MKQSRAASLVESVGSTLTGFLLALVLQATVLPAMLGAPVPLSVNVAFTLVMTAASVARQYLWRRFMEALNLREPPLSPFMRAVAAERRRQVEVEGWTSEHDDAEHEPGELARAGGCYAEWAGTGNPMTPIAWPWSPDWWKPTDFRRDLVKAGALIVAEGEKFDRSKSRRAPEIRPREGGRNFGFSRRRSPEPAAIQARRP